MASPKKNNASNRVAHKNAEYKEVIEIPVKKSEIFTAVNFVKLAVLIGTTLSSVYWGITEFEDRLSIKIKQSVNDAIDVRLNSSLKILDEHGSDITLLKLAAKHTEDYISDNGYRLNFHENFMRDVAGYLHKMPPHDFIKPEEIRFEDFKEKRNKNK